MAKPHPEAPSSRRPLPDRVWDQVRILAERLAGEPRVESVVLLGSLAREEASFAVHDGRLELFSDIELMAVTSGRLNRQARRLLSCEIDDLAGGFGYRNRLFHADVMFRERSRLGSLPPFVFTFELVANGRTVAGDPRLQDVRTVGLHNLDLKNTREILLKRLWALAEALPPEWVRGAQLLPIDQRALSVALHRQPLDVPTVILPLSGALLPTYCERVEYWADHPDTLGRGAFDKAMSGDSTAYLSECLAARAHAEPAADSRSSHRDALTFIESALAVLCGPATGSDLPETIADRSSTLFNERPIVPAEWLNAARTIAGMGLRHGPARALAWAGSPRKGLLAAALLALHHSLAAGLQGDLVNARHLLAEARRLAAPLDEGLVGPPVHGPFPEEWLAARALLGRAFWRTVRLGDPLAWERMQRALGRMEEGTD